MQLALLEMKKLWLQFDVKRIEALEFRKQKEAKEANLKQQEEKVKPFQVELK